MAATASSVKRNNSGRFSFRRRKSKSSSNVVGEQEEDPTTSSYSYTASSPTSSDKAILVVDRPPNSPPLHTPPSSPESTITKIKASLVFKSQEESLRSIYHEKISRPDCPASRNITFSQVKIHYHQTRVGDHLNCDGPPVALGEPTGEEEVYEGLEDYEDSRPYLPRGGEESRLDPVQRLEILQDEGFTVEDIMSTLEESENEFLQQQARTKLPSVVKRSLSKMFRRNA